MNKAWLILFSFIIFSSCNVFKHRKSETTLPPANYLKDKVSANLFDYEWLDARVKVFYSDNTNSKTFNLVIRARKDSVIWLSASLLGFEGMRAIITKDSIKILNKLAKEYLIKDFKYIKDQFYLPDGNFALLEKFLKGNPLLFNTENAAVSIDSGTYLLKTLDNHIANSLWLSPEDFLIQKNFLQDLLYNQNVKVYYNDYKDINGQFFAFDRKTLLERGQRIEVNLNFSKVEKDKVLSFPFSIPNDYKVIY